jgi:catalase
MTERIATVSSELAQMVATNVSGDLPSKPLQSNHGKKAKGLSQLEYLPETPIIETRRVAIFLADGFDYDAYATMKDAMSERGAFVFTIGAVKFWVTESSAHLKSIADVNEAVPFIKKQIGLHEVDVASPGTLFAESFGVVTGYGDAPSTLKVGNVGTDSKVLAEKFIWHISRHRNWQREPDGLFDQIAA